MLNVKQRGQRDLYPPNDIRVRKCYGDGVRTDRQDHAPDLSARVQNFPVYSLLLVKRLKENSFITSCIN